MILLPILEAMNKRHVRRRAQIADYVATSNGATTSDVVDKFKVSRKVARADLNKLVREGRVHRADRGVSRDTWWY